MTNSETFVKRKKDEYKFMVCATCNETADCRYYGDSDSWICNECKYENKGDKPVTLQDLNEAVQPLFDLCRKMAKALGKKWPDDFEPKEEEIDENN